MVYFLAQVMRAYKRPAGEGNNHWYTYSKKPKFHYEDSYGCLREFDYQEEDAGDTLNITQQPAGPFTSKNRPFEQRKKKQRENKKKYRTAERVEAMDALHENPTDSRFLSTFQTILDYRNKLLVKGRGAVRVCPSSFLFIYCLDSRQVTIARGVCKSRCQSISLKIVLCG
jgi:hypothetical protein